MTYVEIISWKLSKIVSMHESSLGKEKSKCLQTVHSNEVLFVSTVHQIILQGALSTAKLF